MKAGWVLGGRYTLRNEVGRGSMGVVWRAHDQILDREVAVKGFSPYETGKDLRDVLLREARMVARMVHPCIVPVFDLGEHAASGTIFFVMPLLRGPDLRSVLDRGLLPAGAVVVIAEQLASALAYSHRLGVVHRDLKPENIKILGLEHAEIHVKVMDFGLAVVRPQEHRRPATIVGTVGYISPEQAAGSAASGRSDLYGLGAVLYECIKGVPVLEGGRKEQLTRLLTSEAEPIDPGSTDVPAAVVELVMQCLARTPDRRPASAAEFLRRLLDAHPDRPVWSLPWTEEGADASEPGLATTPGDLIPGGGGSSRRTTGRGLRSSEGSTALRLGDVLLVHGEYDAALEAFERAREEFGQRSGESSAEDELAYRVRLANVAHKLGRYEDVQRHTRAGLEVAGMARHPAAAELHAWSALAHAASGLLDAANMEISAGFATLSGTGKTQRDPRSESLLYRAHGNALSEEGRVGEAIEAYEAAMRSIEGTADRWERSIARFNLGDACSLAGQHGRADEELERASVEKTAIGDRWGLAYVHRARARVAFDHGDLNLAATEIREGQALARAIGDPKLIAMLDVEQGRLALRRGDVDRARELADAACHRAGEHLFAPEIAQSLVLGAHVALARGALDEAEDDASRAIGLCCETRMLQPHSGALRALAEVHARRKQPDETRQALEEAREIAQRSGNPYRELEVELTAFRLAVECGLEGLSGDPDSLLERCETFGAAGYKARAQCLAATLARRRGDSERAADLFRAAEHDLRALGWSAPA